MNRGPRSIGPLGLSLWLDFVVHLGSKVPPSAFSPPPRVNSRLVMLQPREEDQDGLRLSRLTAPVESNQSDY